jgi:hypothetical protein
MLVALIAAFSMVCADILAVIMVQMEAANRGWFAGAMDGLGWIVGITTTSISVRVLNGHSTSGKVWVILLVTAANVFGTKLGQVIGSRLLRRPLDRLPHWMVRAFVRTRNKGDARKRTAPMLVPIDPLASLSSRVEALENKVAPRFTSGNWK